MENTSKFTLVIPPVTFWHKQRRITMAITRITNIKMEWLNRKRPSKPKPPHKTIRKAIFLNSPSQPQHFPR